MTILAQGKAMTPFQEDQKLIRELRAEIERLQAMYQKSDAENDELREEAERLQAENELLRKTWQEHIELMHLPHTLEDKPQC